MKNIKFALIALVTLSSGLFAFEHDGLEHPIVWKQTGATNDIGVYTDIKEGMVRRSIVGKDGKEMKRIYGDMDIIGATISVPTNGGYNYVPVTGTLWKGTLTNIKGIDDANYRSQCTQWDRNNGKCTLDYFNSSYSTFDFSNKPTELERNHIDGSKVIYARLYWAGGLSNPWNDHPASNVAGLRNKYLNGISGFKYVRFGTPDGKMHRLTANPGDVYWWGAYAWYNTAYQGGMYFMYQASVDVTDLVKASLTKDKRTFSAGGIRTSSSLDDNNWMSMYRDGDFKSSRYYLPPHYGGWALLIVYDFGEDESENIKPKSVNIYDGLRVLDPSVRTNPGSVSKNLELKFEGFYTPPSGNVNSTLAVMSFGGKYETGSEDIQVWDKNNRRYESVTSGQNGSGKQFNSTITKFGSNINSGKTYNNQMDLDVFDISGKIGNAQTDAWINLIAKSEWNSGILYSERANVGLVAFSTELYSPEVCYEETLFTKGKDAPDSEFREVSTNKNSYTKVEKDSILRAQIAIKNKGNESAQKLTLTSSLEQKGSEYKPNTTYIVTSEPITTTKFKVGPHNPDNTAFQTSSKNLLTFALGSGAGHIGSANQGGTIDQTNQAFIQYDATLKQIEKFQANIYRASFTNTALNLSFEGKIKRCDNKEYYLSVIDVPDVNNFRAVNKNFTKDGDSQNLYTQIANRKFDIKIAHFGKETASGNQLSKTNIDTTVGVDIVTTCAAGGVSVTQPMQVEFKKGENGKSIVELKDVLIEKAYSNLYVRLSFKDPISNQIKTSCASDTFTVRPKEFKIYDTSSKNIVNNLNLIGGRKYPNFSALATNDTGKQAGGYTTMLPDSTGTSYARFEPTIPPTCTAVTSLPITWFMTKFTDGVAKLERYQEGATAIKDNRDFVYNEVGNAKLVILDNKWTTASNDQANSDCIANSHSNTESNGKVGCNIRSEFDFTFDPQDIHIDSLRISGFNGGPMSYMSNDIAMPAIATFNVQARLGDASRTIARMYTAGCYSKDTQFTMGVDTGIADLNDRNNVKTPLPAAANARILFFNDGDNPQVVKRDGANNNSGVYNVPSNAFTNGQLIGGQVKFNFARVVTDPINPFTVNSNIFTFTNVREQVNTAAVPNTYVKPLAANETATQFYYGMVYAPYYEGPRRGFNANVYFGVYCNACDKTIYTLANGQTLPSVTNWFTNESHIDNTYGQVNAYVQSSGAGTVTITPQTIANGVQILTLSDTQAELVDIDMQASSWLIYNKTNAAATVNRFQVNFFDRPRWGGQALGQKGNNLNGPGNVLDTEDGSLNYSIKTNKRSDW
nr:hypothetical protein [uncultured Campylobacter sp.]